MHRGVSLEVFKLWFSAPCRGHVLERNGALDGITPEGKGQHHNVESMLPEFISHFVGVVFVGSGFWGV